LSAILKAHKSLPSMISPTTPSRQLKCIRAEHNSPHLLLTLRTTFTLDIPSDAAPVFQVWVGQDVPGDLDGQVSPRTRQASKPIRRDGCGDGEGKGAAEGSGRSGLRGE
ncbi:hypothetical protein C0989_007418, partial [Termitomyces sp. Mn162]